MLNIILPIIAIFAGAIVATIYFIVTQRRTEQRNITFTNEIKEEFERLRKDLPNIIEDGIPYLKSKKKQSLIKEAIGYLKDHKYELSIELFKQYMNIFYLDDTEKAAILNLIGIAYLENKEYLKSHEAFIKLIEVDPKLAEAWAGKGTALSRLDRSQEALEAFEKAIMIDPKHEVAWVGKGMALSRLDRSQEALEAFEKAIIIDPKLAVAWAGKGATLGGLHRTKEALEAFEKAIMIDPNFSEAWAGKGTELSRLNRTQEAFEAFERAIMIDPNLAVPQIHKGMGLRRLGLYQEALTLFERAIEIEPNYEVALYLIASTYSLWRKKDKTLEYLSISISFNPKEKQIARNDKDFDWLREDEEFKRIIAE